MIKRGISLVLIGAALLSSGNYAKGAVMDDGYEGGIPFSDTEEHWARLQISKWRGYNIIDGVSNSLFSPDGKIKRKDFGAIIGRLLGLGVGDVDKDYYSGYLDGLGELGIIKGDSSGNMRVEDYITREEALVVLCRVFGIGWDMGVDNISKYKDGDKVSEWSEGYINSLIGMGVIKGDTNGLLGIKDNITRAEAIVLIDRLVGDYYRDGLVERYLGNKLTMVGENIEVAGSEINEWLNILDGSSVKIRGSRVGDLRLVRDKDVWIESSKIDIVTIEGDNTRVNIGDGNDIKGIEILGDNIEIDGDIGESEITLSGGASIVYKGKYLENNGDIAYTVNKEYLDGYDETYKSNIGMNIKNEIQSKAGRYVGIGISDDNKLRVPVKGIGDELKEVKGVVCLVGYKEWEDGSISYSEPIVYEEYKYNIGLELVATKAIMDGADLSAIDKVLRVVVSGENIPEIKDMRVISNLSAIMDGNIAEYSVTDINKDIHIKYDVDKETGVVDIDKYYGYIIEYNNGDKEVVFPVLNDESIKDIYGVDIETGELEVTKEGIKVVGSSYNGVSEKVGIVYKVVTDGSEPYIIDSSWVDMSVDSLTDVELRGVERIGDIYYSIYIEIDGERYYGDIKSKSLDISLMGYSSELSMSGESGRITVMVRGDISEYVGNIVRSIKFNGDEIIKDVKIEEEYDKNKIQIDVDGLKGKGKYEVELVIGDIVDVVQLG